MRAILFIPLLSLSLHATELRPPLQKEERKNGAQTLQSLSHLSRQLAAATSPLIMDETGAITAMATWVGEDGYLITKASEAPILEKLRARLPDGRLVKLREIRRHTGHDLALAQAIGVSGVGIVAFAPEMEPPIFGQWITSPATDGELRLGVISAQRRKIPGLGAAMGVRMDEKPTLSGNGVRIMGVAEDSPAQAAGLRQGDILMRIGEEPLTQFSQVHQIVSKMQPGELVKVDYIRSGKEHSATVRLASRTKVLSNWEGEDFANGGTSIRTDGFEEILQHDLPLSPADMGGPLLDLEGRALGINIARVDRITTFALPASVFWPEIQEWIHADRHPPKALPAR